MALTDTSVLDTGALEAPSRPRAERSARRYAAHLLVLAAVTLLVLTSTAFAPARTDAQTDPTPGPESLAQVSLDPAQVMGAPNWLLPPTQRGPIVFPEAVVSTREIGLWSGPDDRAVFFGNVPTGVGFRPLGQFTQGRLLVYYPGDGSTRAAGPAWVDAQLLQPAPRPGATPSTSPTATARQVLPPTRVKDTSAPEVSARYIAIVDEASGAVLYSQRPNDRVPPASVTKIATTIVALEQPGINLERQVTATVSATALVNLDGSSVMGIEPGDKVSLRTLLYGMMLPSGNDAAEQIALSLGGTRERFVAQMNDKVRSLGLKDTNFVSPSGMDTPGHYSSAYDMAMLARYAMGNATFRAMAGAPRYQGDEYVMRNANRLIGYYANADGVKIGFTDEARKTIVASATRNGRRVYVSLMRSEDLVYDSVALFDWVWDSFSW